MHQLTDSINEALAEWENLKQTSIPVPCTSAEAIAFTQQKDLVSDLSHKIRISRLENEIVDEELYSDKFLIEFDKFTQDYVYRVLKRK